MEDKVNEATNPNPPMDVVSSAFKLDITRKDIRTLVGLEVISDELDFCPRRSVYVEDYNIALIV